MGEVEGSGHTAAMCLMDTQTPQSSASSDSGRKLTQIQNSFAEKTYSNQDNTRLCEGKQAKFKKEICSNLPCENKVFKIILLHTTSCNFLPLTYKLTVAYSFWKTNSIT